MRSLTITLTLLVLAPLGANGADLFDSSRLLGTGGVTTIEGAAGGGLAPWALIAGQGDRDQIGGTAFYTQANPTNYTLSSHGAALGFFDRAEVSFAEQRFGLGSTVPGQAITQDIMGLKVRLAGDAIYDQDRLLPQIAIGTEYKQNRDFDLVPRALGAKRGDDFDFYLVATKIWLDGVAGHSVLVSAGARATRANQFGILGFGGDLSNTRRVLPEVTLATFATDHVVVGGEFRAKPNNLSAFREQNAWDAFVAWLPTKHLAVTLAFVDLGQIANHLDQTAPYISLQAGF